jgi:hypothetical protein
MDSERLKEIGYRAAELAKLKDHEAWTVLRQVLETKKERWQRGLTKRLIAGEIVDQRDLDYQRGFWAGAFYVLDNPEKAEDSLKAALRKATSMEEGETA